MERYHPPSDEKTKDLLKIIFDQTIPLTLDKTNKFGDARLPDSIAGNAIKADEVYDIGVQLVEDRINKATLHSDLLMSALQSTTVQMEEVNKLA